MKTDKELFVAGISIAEIQRIILSAPATSPEYRRAWLFSNLAALTKYFINERMKFEELLAPDGMAEVSSSIYCLEWAAVYYEAVAKRRDRAKRGYFRNLWEALLNRVKLEYL